MAHELVDVLPPGETADLAACADHVERLCAQAVLEVLRAAREPLPALDLLAELGHRYRGWTSSLVRHTLADLVERGVVLERKDLRPCAYQLA